ncbi:uncharacterized protein LOC117101637 [Anneissia japonica]|uniref:uncharacterized protein LOC117101637 n=1 Tax=Anneissia japonica TaxID=1529436 RepID=UPI0014259DE9|nr:uncharacterized protein LOC117101637 [Anneissia japonica]XP_033097536.1 uncharacterized protein LOC117101637 [Anneissia japonica]XP_033097537.1 uncharacterized protein LOC117101637 [Anneissia japonica]XP_033097538.1 uncharacterized protein LOC117101637 [Anneissia japonica]XP_033097539.1 uncharacterized protein LOC117101637 [Anneissia japonica]XP_033097540.1 uncharacterized protein LOC117101637 [Anneissia japonica]XP_033097541.1 uncharacterized protein LOC117101637 [Anneissia japonica]XP_0
MGCAHSRSENLTMPERVLQSVESSDGYFRQTLQTPMDYILKSEGVEMSNEMSYHGPPSHLQNSIDMHPFWHFYGRDYIPSVRYIDKSHEQPPSLLPTAANAQELRAIELHETMHSLRKQVVGVIERKKNEQKAAATIVEESDGNFSLSKEEQSTLDFLEAALNDLDDTPNDSKDSSHSSLDLQLMNASSNGHQQKNALEVDDELIVDPSTRIGRRVHQNAMYLPSLPPNTRQNLKERILLQSESSEMEENKMDASNMKNSGENMIQRKGSQYTKNQSNANVVPFSKSYVEEKSEKEKLERRSSSVRDLVRLFSVNSEKENVDNSNNFVNEKEELHIQGGYKESMINYENGNNAQNIATARSSRRKSIDDMSDDSAIVTETHDLVDENFLTMHQTAVGGHKKLSVTDSTLTQKSIDSGIS